MNLRRKIIIVAISLSIYFVLDIFYQNVIHKNNFQEMYMLKKDVSKGEEVKLEDLEVVNIDSKLPIEKVDFSEKVFNDGYLKDRVVTSDMLKSKEEYEVEHEGTEIVAIKVDSIEDNVCFLAKKGSMVNVYLSAKPSEIQELINLENYESFGNSLANGFTTFKILDRVKIINSYDKEGNITNGQATDSILIEVKCDMALKINNLKNYGKFSLSLVG